MYSHDGTRSKNEKKPQGRQVTQSNHDSEARDEFDQWKRQISGLLKGRRAGADEFFKTAWTFVDGASLEISQRVIRTLSEEEGQKMISNIIRMLVGASEAQRQDIFRNRVLPLFRTITHPQVIGSCVLEHPLGAVFDLIHSYDGSRAIELFEVLVPTLKDIVTLFDITEPELTTLSVTTTCAVLHKLIESHQAAQVVPAFTAIVTNLAALIPERLRRTTASHINRICSRLGLGALIPTAAVQTLALRNRLPTFEMNVDLPGTLSETGPRHDNDHADITDIKILPTSEEIDVPRQPYLPSCDLNRNHLQGLAGLIDRQFRLLREDTVGQFRHVIRMEIKRLRATQQGLGAFKDRFNDVRHITYDRVRPIRFLFDSHRGLILVVEFDQPASMIKGTLTERAERWSSSKQLQVDSFVCLVTASGRAIFFSVCDSSPSREPKEQKDVQIQPNDACMWSDSYLQPSLSRDQKRAQIALSLVQADSDDLPWVVEHLNQANIPQCSMIEFPGILLPAFKPTLEALQAMSVQLDVPFAEVIAADPTATTAFDQQAPLYTTEPGFAFDLSPLTGGEPISLTIDQPFDMAALQEISLLDDSQLRSTISALSSRLALIQGPPGTGKSYCGISIVKTLLQVRATAKLGPILCVCYTNHALDQLLEHLLDDGVGQIIRIGSRSKSERLEKLNLRFVARQVSPTDVERYEQWKLYSERDKVAQQIQQQILNLQDPGHWTVIKAFLEEAYPSHSDHLFARGVDKDGFQEVKGNRYNVIRSWLQGAPHSLAGNRSAKALVKQNLSGMSTAERRTLFAYWKQSIIEDSTEQMLRLEREHRELSAELQTYRDEVDRRCLNKAHVIGITTTGLARNLGLLRRLVPKVLVVEEAGEVLEAHTLTALLPSIEQAILIGDHEQLRPQINNYDSQRDNPRGEDFSLDVSLFERLVHPTTGHPGLPHSTLDIQRRMFPSIAELIRSTLYPRLKDHGPVSEYPEVAGMRKRLYWLNHENRENSDSEAMNSFSKTNIWEVEMTAALVTHLTRQGTYKKTDIAVLTPYLGQLHKLKQRLRSSFAIAVNDRDQAELDNKGMEKIDTSDTQASMNGAQVGLEGVHKTTLLDALRIATVDNFQGEEAKVIVISLVRSNNRRSVGFLKTSNRINVLLSRAQHGMYIIGDAKTAGEVPMWDQVINILKRDGNIGNAFRFVVHDIKRLPSKSLRQRTSQSTHQRVAAN